ncbi:MAG: hypothetical protein FJZ43_02890 [Candidatus Staskawiczbacteria bacterium]|nr:hypothetical protein [Candidatus Staskawiczbacteria bacterium]
MATQENSLLQKSDIRTMAKDIRQLKKGVFIAKPLPVPAPELKIQIKEPEKVVNQKDANQEEKEKKDLNKILAETSQNRLQHQEFPAQTPVKNPPPAQRPTPAPAPIKKEIPEPSKAPSIAQDKKNQDFINKIHPQEKDIPNKAQSNPVAKPSPQLTEKPPQANQKPTEKTHQQINQLKPNINKLPHSSPIKKSEQQIATKSPTQSLKIKKEDTQENYDERKKKFMEEIEKWAKETN